MRSKRVCNNGKNSSEHTQQNENKRDLQHTVIEHKSKRTTRHTELYNEMKFVLFARGKFDYISVGWCVSLYLSVCACVLVTQSCGLSWLSFLQWVRINFLEQLVDESATVFAGSANVNYKRLSVRRVLWLS